MNGTRDSLKHQVDFSFDKSIVLAIKVLPCQRKLVRMLTLHLGIVSLMLWMDTQTVLYMVYNPSFFVVFAVRRYSISGGVVGSHSVLLDEVPSGDEPCLIIYGT